MNALRTTTSVSLKSLMVIPRERGPLRDKESLFVLGSWWLKWSLHLACPTVMVLILREERWGFCQSHNVFVGLGE